MQIVAFSLGAINLASQLSWRQFNHILNPHRFSMHSMFAFVVLLDVLGPDTIEVST